MGHRPAAFGSEGRFTDLLTPDGYLLAAPYRPGMATQQDSGTE